MILIDYTQTWTGGPLAGLTHQAQQTFHLLAEARRWARAQPERQDRRITITRIYVPTPQGGEDITL